MLTEAQFSLVARQAKRRIGLALHADGLDFVDRRLWPLARREGCLTTGELVSSTQARADDVLWDAIVASLIIPDTSFFPDKSAFKALSDAVIPELLRARGPSARLKIWSAGCASGQEPFSIAIMLEEMKNEGRGVAADILATDLSSRLLDKAASGLYSQFEVQKGLSIHRLIENFERVGEMWRIKDRLRAAVRFDPHNLMNDAPLGPFDIILCRNVLAGFDADDRRAALERLALSLAEDGALILGAGEDASEVTQAFHASHGQGVFLRNAMWKRAA
ncbi:MAG: protein-glutamate O-methyltransferase CheR [Hyphomonadaceae bacterium]|nr:protein-glutamate O-methyltransferase CheR [Hyphomonadaceae bacterium]